MRTANPKIKSARLSQKRYTPNRDYFNHPSSYNLRYPSSKYPSSPSSKQTHTKRIYNNEHNNNLPLIHHNEDLSTLYSLWNDMGVTRHYRGVFESYIRTISSKERRNIIDLEKESVLRIREVYSSLSDGLDFELGFLEK